MPLLSINEHVYQWEVCIPFHIKLPPKRLTKVALEKARCLYSCGKPGVLFRSRSFQHGETTAWDGLKNLLFESGNVKVVAYNSLCFTMIWFSIFRNISYIRN
jgi:hypothetical protein